MPGSEPGEEEEETMTCVPTGRTAEETAAAIAETHEQSAARGKALIALATEQHDVGGGDQTITAMSAIVDLMHAVSESNTDDSFTNPIYLLEMAQSHYERDLTGEW